MVAYSGRENSRVPVVVFKNDNRYVVTAGNMTDEALKVSVKLGKKYLNMTLPAHSFNTFVQR